MQKKISVLVACESSGVVREAFRKKGHHAFSLDVLPAADGSKFHIQQDAISFLSENAGNFDLLIGHPPCTYLTNSAELAYKDPDFDRYPNGGYHQLLKKETLFGEVRRAARREAVKFFFDLWDCGIPRVCLENPIGHISRHIVLRPNDWVPFKTCNQIVQPFQFGDDASKATCLWLKNLSNLAYDPTKFVKPRLIRSGTSYKNRWSNQTDSGQNRLSPSANRWSERSKTYQGIADAMASNWPDWN